MSNTPDLMDVISKALQAATKVKDPAALQRVRHHREPEHVIMLPSGEDGTKPMPVKDAIAALTTLAAASAQVFHIHEQLPGLPLDAAHAFMRAIENKYGWARAESATEQGFFGPFKVKPSMERVKTGPRAKDYVEVVIGDFILSDVFVSEGHPAEVMTGIERSNSNPHMPAYFVDCKVRFEDRERVMALINEAKRIVSEESIYRGKAMRLRVNERGNVESPKMEPEFIDLSKVNPADLIHNEETAHLLEATLFTPIRNAQICRDARIPLNRKITLCGPYGTGKTFTAAVTAKIAAENGWTYVSVDRASGLTSALEFAQMFQPAVVFCEDIDRVATLERNEQANDLMNVIDGIIGKNGSEVIVVMTTNHIDNMHPGMLRPGRSDAIIPVDHPEAQARDRLIRSYAGRLLTKEEDISSAVTLTEGMTASTVSEVVARAKLYAIMRQETRISGVDLSAAAKSLSYHSKLVTQGQKKTVTPEHELGAALMEGIRSATKNSLNGSGDVVKTMAKQLEAIHARCV